MEEQRAYRVEEQDQDSFGEVIIADEVISIIAGIAATEVDGVDSMDGGWSGALGSRMELRIWLAVLRWRFPVRKWQWICA